MYLDDLCGESMSVEEEKEIISLKFWVTGLLSLITGKYLFSKYLESLCVCLCCVSEKDLFLAIETYFS